MKSSDYKPKVLLADDDITTVMLLRASISQLGFSIVEAKDGEEALNYTYAPEPPGIAIVDWMMPKLDGIAFCEKVHNTIRPRPYQIILTHNKGTVNLVKAIESGADEFIEKPINLEELRCRLLVGVRILSDIYFKFLPKSD